MFLLKKDTIIKYLITLIPFSLVFSIFITEVFLILLIIFYFYDVRNENLLNSIFLNFSFLGYFLVSYFLYVSLNSIFLENELFFRKTIFYFRFYFYFLSILYFIKKLDLYNLVLRNFFFIFIVLILDAMIQFILGYNIIGMPIVTESRVSSFFGDELILGSYITRLLPFFLIFVYELNHKVFFKFIYLLGIVLVIILSGERTALFLLLLSIFIFFVSLEKLRLYLLYIFALFMIIFVSLINLNSDYYKRYYLNVVDGFGLIKTTGIKTTGNFKLNSLSIFDSNNNLDVNIFSKHYQDHYKSAYKIFKNNPVIGGGTKSFRYLCKKTEYKVSNISCSTHPHNILMQFLSELGTIGLIFLICFHLLIGKDFIKILKFKRDEKSKLYLAISLTGLIINIFPLIPSGNFFNNWLSIVFVLNLVNYIYLRQKYLND